ncbi:LysR family transcriptional regulator [Paraburkholderia acidicola]|uniref:LysR family transcriptional regulator n=1 Tax=Paraburkholderia acidicola TaxID=1912599 RepID=A0A2A4ENI0_9BURK|nr:LysR family transcriptional regulator [Paraburkholderia acidicola]
MQNSTDSSKPVPGLQWDDIRYFLAAARGGSLSGAARTLGVQHSTVARRIDAMEQMLGVRLFDRLPRGWPLTTEGQLLVDHAVRIEEEAHAFERASRGAVSLQGTVRLSVPPGFGSHFLVPRLAAWRRAWPGIQLDIVGEARAANLFRREADLAVRLGRPPEPGLAARRLGTMRFSLRATADWLGRPPSEWEFIGYNETLTDAPQQQWLVQFAGARPFALIANDLTSIYRACRAGAGVALLPGFIANGDDALTVLDTQPACDVEREIWLAVHPDVRRSPRVQAVAEAIAQAVHDAGDSL